MLTNPLFQPLQLGQLTLPNRVLMSPLTRSRAKQPGDIPEQLNATYYSQRASAGLIFTEATQISPQGKGYAATPGIYSLEQIRGWHLVTDAVHQAGGRIYLQLWHVGRISHRALQPNGALPVAPSAIKPDAKTYIEIGKPKVEIPQPHALEIMEIPGIVEQYRQAAKNAMDAGFDGVELHAGYGYLIDQFLRDSTNKRDDKYGGSLENRLRFPLEVIEAIIEVWGAEKVGVRIAPTVSVNDIYDTEPMKTFTTFADRLNDFKVSFLEVVEQRPGQEEMHPQSEEISAALRHTFKGVYIANGGYNKEKAITRISEGKADAITFGRLFLANPDLPKRLRLDAKLNLPDSTTFYGGDARGYIDYPSLDT